MQQQALADGTRIIQFETPCGIEVYLCRLPTGSLKMRSYIGNQPVAISNGETAISAAGARRLAQALTQLYQGGIS